MSKTIIQGAMAVAVILLFTTTLYAQTERRVEKRTVAPVKVKPAPEPAAGKPGGVPGSGPTNIAGGCCQKPAPQGLDCCDTRDCGWFDCSVLDAKPPKPKLRVAAKPPKPAAGQPGGGMGGGPSNNFAAGDSCCQKPGPSGLHCCDTRDCGWFDCND